ncbi:MAG: circadian clock protein KaiC [Candidatus Thermoplasmatota archaeon]
MRALPKAPTGIAGLDALTGGGLPRGRCTLVCGGPGSGKTLLGAEFLVRGARDMGEPGVLITFEESPRDLEQNVASLGFDLKALQKQGKIVIDQVIVNRAEIEEAGAFDLEGLFLRIGYAVDRIGAKRILLDTPESLFSVLPNPLAIRSELRRLFGWLKDRGLTAVITAELGEKTLTREGLEEYVSDCVIVLNQKVRQDVATRRLHILKYRGSAHVSDEVPFIIDERGFTVTSITQLLLNQAAPLGRIPSGVPSLDRLLGGKGFYRGSVVLVSGTAGTGKTTLAAHFLDAACRRGERALFFSFEESPQTLVRDMRSIGIDLDRWVRKGLLRFHSVPTNSQGLEGHLAEMHRKMEEFHPQAVVIDPISGFISQGDPWQAKNMLVQLSDSMRASGATTMLTNLSHGREEMEQTNSGISSAADAWILLRDTESDGERNRLIHILKARGIGHSNQVHEFHLTAKGVRIRPPYIGDAGVLAGSARLVQEARDSAHQAALAARVADVKAQLARQERSLRQSAEGVQAEHDSQQGRLARALAAAQAAHDSEQGRLARELVAAQAAHDSEQARLGRELAAAQAEQAAEGVRRNAMRASRGA